MIRLTCSCCAPMSEAKSFDTKPGLAPPHRAALAASLLLATVALALAGPAAAQSMSQRQMMQLLAPMMQDPNFDSELNQFAAEHNLDPNMLKALIAKKMGPRARKQLRQMQKMQQQQQQLQQQQKPEWMQR
jgi:hypothetical protein